MPLRSKTAIILAAIFAGYLAVSYVIRQTVLLPVFHQLEIDHGQVVVDLHRQSMDEKAAHLSQHAHEFTDREELRRLWWLEDTDIQDRLSTVSFSARLIEFLVLAEHDGRIVYSSQWDPRSEELKPSALFREGTFLPPSVLSSGWTRNEDAAGIFDSPHGPLIGVLIPLADSADPAALRGLAFFGSFTRAHMATALSDGMQHSFEILSKDQAAIPPDATPFSTRAVDEFTSYYRFTQGNNLELFTPLHDPHGNPAAMLRATVPLSATRKGYLALQTAMIAFIIISLGVFITLLLLVDRTILRRFTLLSKGASLVTQTGDLSVRVPEEGKDEIGQLSRDFNRMLLSLESSNRALRQSETRFTRAFRGMPSLVALTRVEDGVILDINDSFTRITGYSRHECLGRSTVSLGLISPDSRTRMLSLLNEHGRVVDFEMRVRKKSGDIIWGVLSADLIEFEGTSCLLAIITDITEQKRIEEERRLTIEFLQLLNSRHAMADLSKAVCEFIRRISRAASVTLRVAQDREFPCLATGTADHGSPIIEDEIYRKMTESCPLVEASGVSVLGCLHSLIDQGQPAAVTSSGSFWTNEFQPIVQQLSRRDCCAPLYEYFSQRHISSIAIVPLRSSGSIFGLLEIGDTRSHRLDESMILFIERLGEHLSSAVTRVRSEEALQSQLLFMEGLLHALPSPVFYMDERGRYLGANPAFEKFFDVSLERIRWHTSAEVWPGDIGDAYDRENRELIRDGGARTYPGKPFGGVPSDRVYLVHKATYTKPDGTIGGIVGAIVDVTDIKAAEEERRRLEAQMLQAQKLEGLGVMAGGIAHDFNNLLVGILGNADLALLDIPHDSPIAHHISEIVKASQHAADLCQQMLVYAGRGQFHTQPIDLNELVRDMADILSASISKKATLHRRFADRLPTFGGDVTQIRQIIMNLIINASEALQDKKGDITLVTGESHFTEDYFEDCCFPDPLPAGRYVFLEVTDNGIGMDAETRNRVFEPFFTTKFTGRGLGMAAVLGIVRGHRGAIALETTPGRGTTFRIHFPATIKIRHEPASSSAGSQQKWKGSGCVLLIDDERAVRTTGRLMLERLGFQVLDAEDGEAGLTIFREQGDRIGCVILDLTMPNLDGRETLRELRKLSAEVPVVISTGFNEQDLGEEFRELWVAAFLHKPYNLATLTGVMQQVYDHESSEFVSRPDNRSL